MPLAMPSALPLLATSHTPVLSLGCQGTIFILPFELSCIFPHISMFVALMFSTGSLLLMVQLYYLYISLVHL